MTRKLGVLALLVAVAAVPVLAQRHHAVVMPSFGHDDMSTQMLGLTANVGGIVQTVSGSLITIANGTITIDASHAEIVGPQGDSMTVAAIHAGDRIEATAATDNVAAGAPIVAQRIVVGRVDVIDISGTIQAVNTAAKTFTLLGRTIAVTSDTRFVGAKSFSDLTAGEHVMVTAEVRNGGLTALSVVDMLASHNGTAAFFDATVKTSGATQWVITSGLKDITLQVNSSTKIASGIKAGDKVNVLANYDGQTYTATVIGPTLGSLDVKLIVEAFGQVKSTGATWVIHDQRSNTDVTMQVTSQTIVQPGIAAGDIVAATALNTTTPPTAVVITKMPMAPM